MSVLETARGVIYRFDKFELLVDHEELRKRGTLVRLGPQPFRVLLLLVSRAGDIVTREEIQQALWGTETFVDFDQGINAVIRRIRTALGDQAETPRFLHTLPRRGYCFVAPVERIVPDELLASLESMLAPQAPSPVQPRRLRTGRLGSLRSDVRIFAAIALVASTLFATRAAHVSPGVRSRDVLRIAVASPNRSLSTELRNRVARIRPERIRVVDGDADLRIESTLSRATDGLRVDARITDANNGREIWSETFHRRSEEADDFPLEVALRVARAVAERYAPPKQREAVVRSRVSPRALALYREGLAARARPQPQRDLNRALSLLEEAVKLEPRFAEAWSAIGDIWTERASGWPASQRAESVPHARRALDRALELDPNSVEALNNRGVLLMQFDHSYDAAEQALRRAIAGDPEYADARHNLAMFLGAMGQHEEAVAQYRVLQTLVPESVPSPTLAFLYLMGQRYNDATAEYRAALLVLRRPHISQWGMMSAAIAARRWKDAAHALGELRNQPVVLDPRCPDEGVAFRRELRGLEEELLRRERAAQIDPYALACFYAQIEENDRALAALDRSIADGSLNATFAYVDPRLDRVRNDPRFAQRLERLGFRR